MRVLAVVAVALVAAHPAPAAGFPRFGGGCSRADFRSGHSVVRAEFCPAHRGPGAAVVVLHGCGGFSTFDHRLVTSLPAFGISTLDVDYFGPTPPPGTRGFCNGAGAFDSAFPVWIRVVDDAAKKLRTLPGVSHVGVVGWSLGGGVAVAAASGPPSSRPFQALAGFSTGSFGAAANASLEPPTILLSGGSTDAIPLSRTLPLYLALRAAKVPSQLYVYPHGSHSWPGRQGTLGIAHAAAFLLRYLR